MITMVGLANIHLLRETIKRNVRRKEDRKKKKKKLLLAREFLELIF